MNKLPYRKERPWGKPDFGKGRYWRRNDASTPHFLTKRNKAEKRKSKSTRGVGMRRASDPRERGPPEPSSSAQRRGQEGNPEGGAPRGTRCGGKDVQAGPGDLGGYKTTKLGRGVGLNHPAPWAEVTRSRGRGVRTAVAALG